MFKRSEDLFYTVSGEEVVYTIWQTDNHVVYLNKDVHPQNREYWVEISAYTDNRVEYTADYTSTESMMDAFKNARHRLDIKKFERI